MSNLALNQTSATVGGQIDHQDQPYSRLVILRREYLERINQLCDCLHMEINTAIRCCAAKLLDYFLHWRRWKLSTHRSEWFYQPLKAIHRDLMGEHSLHVIRAALDLLRDLELLDRRNNPRNKQDRTYQYRVNVSAATEPTWDDKNSSEDAKFRSEVPKFNVEKSDRSQLPPISIKANKTAQTVKNEQEGSDRLGTTSTQQDDPNLQTRQLIAEVRDAGIRLNPTIQRVIAETVAQLGAAAMERIRNATAVVSHSKQARNPEGLFMKAIKLGWQPRRSPQDSPQISPSVTGEPEPLPAADSSRSPLPAQAQTPPGFKEWFDLACSVGLVRCSTQDPGYSGHDEHCVLMSDGWIPTDQAMKLHPVSELQEIANRR